MKLKITIFFIAILLTGCYTAQQLSQTSGLSEPAIAEVPSGAKVIIAEVENNDVSALFDEVMDILIERGHRIENSDKERHYVTTEGKSLGESTLQRMNIFISTLSETNCRVTIRTDWKPGTQGQAVASFVAGININAEWEEASWEINRLGIALAESIMVAKQINKATIRYE